MEWSKFVPDTAGTQDAARGTPAPSDQAPYQAPYQGHADARVVDEQVSFQWKNPDFLFKDPDFQLKNPDFQLKNVDFLINHSWEHSRASLSIWICHH